MIQSSAASVDATLTESATQMARKHAASTNGVVVPCDSQDEEEDRSSLQHRYRELSHLVEERRPHLVQPSNTELLSLVQKANQLTREDQTPTERLMDARLFRSLTRCGDVKGRRLSFGSAPMTPLEVVLAIGEKYKMDVPRISMEGDHFDASSNGDMPVLKLDWARMGEDLTAICNQPPGMTCMKGWTVCIEKKQRAPRTHRRRERPSDNIQEPERHAARDVAASASDTERTVHRIWSSVQEGKHRQGIPLTQLALDHDSYPRTVVTMFEAMFLIKDLRISLKKRRDGTLIVTPVPQRLSRMPVVERHQTFISLTFKMWDAWCQQISPRECLVPKEEEEQVHQENEEDREEEEEIVMEEVQVEPLSTPCTIKSERSKRGSSGSKGKKIRRRLS